MQSNGGLGMAGSSASRPPVPPPPYAFATINKVARGRSLRGVILVATIASFIWSIVVGISYLRHTDDGGVSSRLKAIYIAQGVMFITLAGLETVGFWAAWKQQIKAGRLYVLATIAGGILMTATEVTRMALHFVFKSDIKSACITQNTGYDTADNIQSYCDSDWNNGIWRDAAWLVFGVICSIFMYILSKAYYHQLLDPNYGRQAPASNRYRMGALNTPSGPASAGYGPQDPPFNPPYGSSPYPAPEYVGDHYSQPPMYDVPAYTPPEKGFVNVDMKGSDNAGDSKASGDVGLPQSASSDRDLSSQIEHNTPFIPGRQGEGRV